MPIPDQESLPPLAELYELRRDRALHLARAGAASGLCADQRERPRRSRDRLPARRLAAGDRAGRCPGETPLAGGASRPSRPPAFDAHRGRARSPRATADAARHDRLEPRPARSAGEDAFPPAERLRRRLDTRGGGGGRRAWMPARRSMRFRRWRASSTRVWSTNGRRRTALADEPRYGMLETIREFASEQLAASGEIIQVERAFEEFLISACRGGRGGAARARPAALVGRLEAEHDNLRAALGRALERGDGAVALRLALRLWEFWWTRGYRREGRAGWSAPWHWRDQSTWPGEPLPSSRWANSRLILATTMRPRRTSSRASRRAGSSVMQLAEAEVLSALAMIAVNRLAYDEAQRLGEEALKISRESGDRRSMATALRILGMIAREQGRVRARPRTA